MDANTTQAFMMVDNLHDANIIVVSFRGTEVFEANDWASDLDFSWYKLHGLGKVHVGFLEALGLVNRSQHSTFRQMQQNCQTIRNITDGPSTSHSSSKSYSVDNMIHMSGLTDKSKPLAFDDIRSDLREILIQHPRGRVYLTGHSLGGALACLFMVILMYCDDKEVLSRIDWVWTFGQPRVGDEELGIYTERGLMTHRSLLYRRVVFNNDIVPRVPPDDSWFQFKHFGGCHFIDWHYREKMLVEEPNPNYFFLWSFFPIRWNALLEFLYSLRFCESPFAIIYKMLSLMLAPGLSNHSIDNYINAILRSSKE